MKKQKRNPYRQGSLDGLCGIYSVVNVVRYLCGPLTQARAQTLFQDLLAFLEPKPPLSVRMVGGVVLNEIGGMLGQVVTPAYPVKRRKPFQRQSAVSLDQYWTQLQTFLQRDSTVVLTAIGGHHDHWTLIREATNHSLLLYDSDGLHRLDRRHCTLSQDNPDGCRHILYPAHTYFLWVD